MPPCSLISETHPERVGHPGTLGVSAAAALKESAARFSKAVDAAEAEAAAAAPAEAPAEAPAVELAGLKTVGFSSDMAA